MNPDRALLLEILSYARPHKSRMEKQFAREFLDPIDGMQADAFGNRWLDIGDRPTVMWSSHIDTVAAQDGHQLLAFDTVKGIASLANGKPGMSLGADDGAGVWLMLQMIAAGRPGRYVFHRGEEEGCLGSRHVAKHTRKLLSGIEAAVAFDRAGTQDIITHQMGYMTASDDFAWSLAAELGKVNGLNLRPDPTGAFTDTECYTDDVAECSNVSVGYTKNHGPRETLDVHFCERLLEGLLQLDVANLAIVRTPGDRGWDGYGIGGGSRFAAPLDELPFGAHEDMLEAVRKYPAGAARMLLEAGFDAREVLEAAPWECEDDI